jgi:molecular chaperone DnaK
MTGDLPDVVLLDVASHSLGVRVAGDRVSPIVKRNATVPTRATKVFATSRDDQPYVTIEVYQGESPTLDGNRLLGRFELGDLPPGPAGHVKVQVSFTLDVDGIVRVEATDLATGRATSKKILASSGLSPAEVEQIARERGYRLG